MFLCHLLCWQLDGNCSSHAVLPALLLCYPPTPALLLFFPVPHLSNSHWKYLTVLSPRKYNHWIHNSRKAVRQQLFFCVFRAFGFQQHSIWRNKRDSKQRWTGWGGNWMGWKINDNMLKGYESHLAINTLGVKKVTLNKWVQKVIKH